MQLKFVDWQLTSRDSNKENIFDELPDIIFQKLRYFYSELRNSNNIENDQTFHIYEQIIEYSVCINNG